MADQPLGRAVEDADAVLRVHPDDPGAGARQHGFGETAAAVDQIAGAHDVVVLGAQLPGHLVEGFAELRQVALPGTDRHLHEQIAGRDDLRRIDQPADRRHQVIGEIEPDPDRDQEHDERDHRVHQGKRDLNAQPTGLELGILGDAGLRGAQLGDHLRVEDARHVEIGVGIGLQLDDGGNVVGIEEQRDLRLGLVAGGEHLARGLDEGLADIGAGLLDHVEVAVDHHDRRQAADVGLGGEELPELVAVLIEQRAGARHLDGGGDAVGAQELGMLAHIGVRDDQRVLDQRLGLPRKQLIEPAVERDARHHRDQDRRNRRHHREQGDDPHMQPRGGPAAAARLHDAPDLAGHGGDQKEHRHRIGEQEGDHHLVVGLDRREVGQHHEGRERRQERQRHRAKADRARQPAGRRGGARHDLGCGCLADGRHVSGVSG